MKKASYTIGSLVILLIAAFAFILTPGMMKGCSPSAGNVSFAGENINFESASFRKNLEAASNEFTQRYGNQFQGNSEYQHRYIYQQAFARTVSEAFIKNSLKKAHWSVPQYTIDTAIREMYTKDGKLNKKAYLKAQENGSNADFANNYSEQLLTSRFAEDNFGSNLETGRLFGLKTSKNEFAFIEDMNKKLRSFDAVSYEMSNYPAEEKTAYGMANPDKFKKFDLNVITCEKESDAKDLVSKINKKEMTFGEAVVSAKSMRSYSTNGEGKFTYTYAYQMKPMFKNEADIKKVEALKKDEISAPIQTNIGYTVFKANEEAVTPNFKDEDVVKAVGTYIQQYEFSRMQDFYTEKAKEFIEAANKDGFTAACKAKRLTKLDVAAFPLNYGNSAMLESVPAVGDLSGLARNENFLKTAFSLEPGKISEPMVIGNNVVVIKFNKESDNANKADEKTLEQKMLYADQMSADYAIMASLDLNAEFNKLYNGTFKFN